MKVNASNSSLYETDRITMYRYSIAKRTLLMLELPSFFVWIVSIELDAKFSGNRRVTPFRFETTAFNRCTISASINFAESDYFGVH